MAKTTKKRGRPAKKKSKGLGDRIEEITKATGIKAVVELINGGECSACAKRKAKLNKLFPEVVYNLKKGIATKEQKEVLKHRTE